ncbi:GATA transcription factor 26 [Heracleum sosnowskyi]|uniref:GATA transcription factor 26 n=1 Tax=Heracleum sosnowskyi TaxID=360622 RepID=A0AAD8MHP1_9APIA|nr:GATA transcription factor 26 [Heracleum sosnowskyi]
MVKQGPCCHCGVTSTPLWRNGPEEKPVLCNACGSRWRTKGSLANYTPLNMRAEPAEIMDYRVQQMRAITIKNKEAKVLKRKQNHDVEVAARVAPNLGFHKGASDTRGYNQGYFKTHAEDISNRSSSGSAVSNSESCVHLGCADASDLTGAAQSVVWDSMVPSRKRTCVGRAKPSSVEKLTKDLYAILQEQTNLSGSTVEDLLLECDTPTVSVEIGHGSVLIRHPSSIAREEESEASSLSVSNKPCPANEACSQFTTLCNRTLNKFDNFSSAEIKEMRLPGQEMEQELYKREKGQQEKLEILENHKSPIYSMGSNVTKCKSSSHGSLIARGNAAVSSAKSPDIQRLCDNQLQNLPGSKKVVESNYENEASCFGPNIQFKAPRDSTYPMLDCFQFEAESSDHDLLLNIPSNSSFPQAELLLPDSGFGAQASTSNSQLCQNHVLSRLSTKT